MWKDLPLSDNFLFSATMSNPHICKQTIETLLGIKIDKIEYLETEKDISNFVDSKSIRLDVFVKDSSHTFNLEMQVANKHDLPLRARYYQSNIDAENTLKGVKYSELPHNYVIFICTFDYYKAGYPRYDLETTVRQLNHQEAGDKVHKVFFNTEAVDNELDEDLKAFLLYVKGIKTDNPFIKKLDKCVQDIKGKRKWRSKFMTYTLQRQDDLELGYQQGLVVGIEQGIEQGIEKGIEQGIEKGVEKAKLEMIYEMLVTTSDSEISRITKLPIQRIAQIREEQATKLQ